MSLPRQVLPGTTYLVSRRCAQRQLLLRPCKQTNAIFRFCAAVAAERFGIELHTLCVLSNHYHLVLTDPDAKLPAFMHWLNEYVAKCVNASLGRWESFWAPGSYSAVRLVDRKDVIDKMVYTYANPVSAGLVKTSRQWPGVRSLPEDLEASKVGVPRPTGFFREQGPTPERAELFLTCPPALRNMPIDEVRQLLREELDRKERELRQQAKREGRHFLGVRKVLAQSTFDQPRTREPRRGLNPRVASRDKWRRIEALGRLKSFLQAYVQARRRWINGERSVLFPPGTYSMRVQLKVCLEATPAHG